MIDKDTQTKINMLNALMHEKKTLKVIFKYAYIPLIFSVCLAFKIMGTFVAIMFAFSLFMFVIIYKSTLISSKVKIKKRYRSVKYYGLENVYYDPQTSHVMLISDNLYTTYLGAHIYEPKHYVMEQIINEHLGKYPTYVKFNDYVSDKKKNNDRIYDFEN